MRFEVRGDRPATNGEAVIDVARVVSATVRVTAPTDTTRRVTMLTVAQQTTAHELLIETWEVTDTVADTVLTAIEAAS